jgi:hypothetical protein
MSDRKFFQDSVSALPDQAGLTQHGLMVNAAQPDHGTETMKVLFSLSMPEDARQQHFVGQEGEWLAILRLKGIIWKLVSAANLVRF